MTTYLPVGMGIDMSAAWRKEHETTIRLTNRTPVPTKTWLRKYLAANPQKDFRNLGSGGTYVNGQDALRYDLTLEFNCRSGPALISFQPTDTNDWGYQAVVR